MDIGQHEHIQKHVTFSDHIISHEAVPNMTNKRTHRAEDPKSSISTRTEVKESNPYSLVGRGRFNKHSSKPGQRHMIRNRNTQPSEASVALSLQSTKPCLHKSSISSNLKHLHDADIKRVCLNPAANMRNGVTIEKCQPMQLLEKEEDCTPYAQPELNSALHLAHKLQQIQLEEFNATLAVQTKLDSSYNTRRTVEMKATQPVNVDTSKIIYKNTVSLQYDENATLLHAASLKAAKHKLVQPQSRTRDEEPDIKDFFTDDLQQEFISSIPEIEMPMLNRPISAPVESAFTMYRHRMAWQTFLHK